MALPEPHLWLVQQAPLYIARILVNDIPFYRRVTDHHHAPAGPFNHLMVEGENVVTIHLDELEATPMRVRTFTFSVLRESDKNVLFRANYPDWLERLPEDQRKLPCTFVDRFIVDFPSPPPVWVDAPTSTFPREGLPEQQAAVRELHEAYRRQNIDTFLTAAEHKLAEHRKFYGQMPNLAPEAARKEYGEILRQPWDLDPWDPEGLVFTEHADGRVCFVTRKDGTHALQARHTTDPSQEWLADLLLTQIDGRWRIFW